MVAHLVGSDYRAVDYFNPVDDEKVPVPHFGAVLCDDDWEDLAQRLTEAGVQFIIPPTLRFSGQRGEQKTMFFKDPSNNNLEFKAMTNTDYLFEKEGTY